MKIKKKKRDTESGWSNQVMALLNLESETKTNHHWGALNEQREPERTRAFQRGGKKEKGGGGITLLRCTETWLAGDGWLVQKGRVLETNLSAAGVTQLLWKVCSGRTVAVKVQSLEMQNVSLPDRPGLSDSCIRHGLRYDQTRSLETKPAYLASCFAYLCPWLPANSQITTVKKM